MKRYLFSFIACLSVCTLFAVQKPESVLLKMDGAEFSNRDFEDFCISNNLTVDSTCGKKKLYEYVSSFEKLKLKVREAEENGLDSDTAFAKEFSSYRSKEAAPYLTDSAYYDRMAHSMFQEAVDQVGVDGYAEIAIIMLSPESRSDKDLKSNEFFADSVHAALKNGANFADYARRLSSDATREKGGYYGRVQRSDFQDKIVSDIIFALDESELSEPIPLYGGSFLIVYCITRVRFDSFEKHAPSIYSFMEQNGYREKAIEEKGKNLIRENGWSNLTPQQAIAREDSLLEDKYPDFRRLVSVYYDGLLMYKISQQELWDKIRTDTVGLVGYFDKHIKDYEYPEPAFQGFLIKCQDAQQFDSICNCLDLCRTQLDLKKLILANNLISTECQIIEGPFVKGKNAHVDNLVYGSPEAKPEKRYPYINVYGKMSRYPQYYEVKQQVFIDYQNYLENKWVKELKSRYHSKIVKKSLKAFLCR